MKKKELLVYAVFSLLLNSCSILEKSDDILTSKTSIIRKWYINSEDDRYFYNFMSDGSLLYQYYQNLGSYNSNLNKFVAASGNWKYLNWDKKHFSVSWNDSIDCYYYIKEENADQMEIEKDTSGPSGRGLGNITELLKSALSINVIVPGEIVNLIGIWYYDEIKDGKYLVFQTDGTCYYHYFQNFGTDSPLNEWVNINGLWSYNSDSKKLSVTMNGEITYSYDITTLDANLLQLYDTSSSMINNSTKYYK
jgi:hypothetical protein